MYYYDEPLAIRCAACGDYVIYEEVDENFGQGDVCKECVEELCADFEVFTRD
jgi:formylmethanofuran dehydrogenase subunit E